MEIDLSEDIQEIFQRFLMKVTLGADIDALSVKIYKKENSPYGSAFVLESMTVSEAIDEVFK